MPSLPYDIAAHIVDILAAQGDLAAVKNASLASSALLHLSRRHIFHTIPTYTDLLRSLKRPFISLLLSNPAIAQYIRILHYEVHPDDHQLSPLLPTLLQTISHLECLRMSSATDSYGKFDWTTIDPLLQSALLHLMHLPTLTRFDIARARNIPISALAPCINLKQLDISYITVAPSEELGAPSAPAQTPRILHFRTDSSQTAVGKLLRARWKDGHPVLDFTHVKTLVLDFDMFHDVQLTEEVFKTLGHLEELHINAQNHTETLAGLSETISVHARNLRTLQVKTVLKGRQSHTPMIGLCEELEALAGNQRLQILRFTFSMDGCESRDVVETAFARLEQVLMDHAWSALICVAIEIRVTCCYWVAVELGLESVPEMYLARLLGRKILYYKCPDILTLVE